MRLISYFNSLEKRIEKEIGVKSIQEMLNILGQIENFSKIDQK